MRLRNTKPLHRRQFLHLAAGVAVGVAASPAVSRIARAETYPSRPVRIIVPFAAGGGTDITARVIAQWLSERLGQQFVVENRPGGGTNIGTEAATKATPDGYTLLMVGTSNVINPTLYEKLNFNFIRDIVPIAGVIRAPFVLDVNLAIPVRTVPEFIAYVKSNPGKVNMASSGSGSASHMTGELFKMMAGVDMQHVPYRGGGPALLDLIAGQVQVYFAGLPETIAYIRGGQVRPLAVTSATHADALPDLPAVAEFVPGYESNLWFGVGAPSGTAPDIVDKLNREINAGLADPKLKARYAELGSAVFPTTPGDFGKLFVEETEKWAKVVKFSGAKPE
jgi:tripartite-type tricarboxylate transporter receptor subunit TctC